MSARRQHLVVLLADPHITRGERAEYRAQLAELDREEQRDSLLCLGAALSVLAGCGLMVVSVVAGVALALVLLSCFAVVAVATR